MALAALLGLWPLAVTASSLGLALGTLERLLRAGLNLPDQAWSLLLVGGLAGLFLGPILLPANWRPRSPQIYGFGLAVALLLGMAVGAQAFVAALWTAGILIAAAEAGRLVLARLRLPGACRLEVPLFRVAVGLGVLGLLGLAVGLAGGLEPAVAVVLVGAPVLVAAVRRRDLLRSPLALAIRLRMRLAAWRRVEVTRLQWVWVGSALAMTVATLTLAVAPDVQSDAVRVHLALARRIAEDGEVAVLDRFPLTRWPLLVQTLYALGVLVHDTITAKLLHAAAGIGFSLAAGVTGWKLGGRRAGLLAAALVATLPVVAQLMGTAYVDLFAAWLALLAVLAFLNWQRTAARAWPWLAGGCLGLAVAAKLTAGFVAAGLGLAFLLVGRRRGGFGERLAGAAGLAGGALLALGPWLARSVAATGTVPGVSLFLAAVGQRQGPAASSLANLPGFGSGRSLAALARLPWDLGLHTSRFGENLDGFAGLALLGLLPLVVLLPRRRPVLALGLVTAVTVLLWFLTAQYLRYLLPALGLLAPLAATALARLPEWAAGAGAWTQRVARWCHLAYDGMVMAALIGAPALFLSTVFFVYPGSLPVKLVAGGETPTEYLDRKLASHAVLRRLDAMVPRGAPVVMLPDGPQLYTKARLVSNMTGGDWILSALTPEALLSRFADHQVKYLVLERQALPPSWNSAVVLQPDFLLRHGRVLYAKNGVYLYRVGEGDGAGPPAGRELLRNGGFEALGPDGLPFHWQAFGGPAVDDSGARAHGGRVAVLARTEISFAQSFPARPGHAYGFSYFTRCEPDGALTRLQLHWLDGRERQVGLALEVLPAAVDYQRRTLWVEAPPAAVSGLVRVVSHDEAPCWFDDVSVRDLGPQQPLPVAGSIP